MEKVNLYINSKNRSKTENVNHMNISLPNGLLACNQDEYFILNVNSFYTCANWYNCTNKNNLCKLITKDNEGIITETINIELPIGNLNVLQISSILNNAMANHVIVTYDSITNKFLFVRKHHPSPNDYSTILNVVNCGNFIGFDNGNFIEITHEGIKSHNKINVITLKAINIKVTGDINMLNSTIDNFSSQKFQANDILFHKVIDTKSNNVLGYKNSDASNNFNYVLSNNNSGQINFFTISILDQDLNFIEDIDDYFLHLQFIKMKKQNTDALLMKIVEYVKDIFLVIGNYLYPSKVNSFLEQQILLYPPKIYSKYKNPN
jgi:hypothetical protein